MTSYVDLFIDAFGEHVIDENTDPALLYKAFCAMKALMKQKQALSRVEALAEAHSLVVSAAENENRWFVGPAVREVLTNLGAELVALHFMENPND